MIIYSNSINPLPRLLIPSLVAYNVLLMARENPREQMSIVSRRFWKMEVMYA